MSCCPPESHPCLVSSYVPIGNTVEQAGVEFYEVNKLSSDHCAVIVVPDWFGWAGGHTRNIADLISKSGYHVVVPRLLTPFIEGDDDGCSENFDQSSPKLLPWLLGFKWDTTMPKMEALLSYLRSTGAKKIGMVGFCWGGWVIAHTAVIAPDVVCGFIPHPSIQLETYQGGNLGELMSQVKCPMMLLLAGNDSPVFSEGGEAYEAMKINNPDREFVRHFPDMIHGWVSRGDMTDPIVKRDKELSIEMMQNFLKEHLSE
eukprot:gene10229-21328_t